MSSAGWRLSSRLVLLGVLTTGLPLANGPPPVGATEAPAPSGSDSLTEERVAFFIAMLKRRALQALEAHQAPPPAVLSSSAAIAQGYESNVNLDGSKRGDFFTQETLGMALNPALTSWLKGELAYDLLHTHYAELRDANLWMNTLSGTAQLSPHQRVRVDLGYEFSLVNFPFDTSNSFADQRTGVSLWLAHLHWLTHKVGWTYQRRLYDTRKARDGSGADLLGADREDQRHVVGYELRMKFPKTSARFGGELYRNFSNDLFEDFYDWEDYQVRGVLSRVLRPAWIGLLVSSYERRNYQQRGVPVINVAERDDLFTLAASLIHLLTEDAQLTYSLSWRYQDSNDPRLDFLDWTNQVQLSLNF
jgi:hypothetical protein